MEVGVADQAAAFRVRHRLLSDWQSRLVPVLESELNRMNPDDRWLYLDQLQIKVRIDDPEKFSADFYEQCRRELHRQLSSITVSGEDYTGASPELINDALVLPVSQEATLRDANPVTAQSMTSLTMLFNYARVGRRPWYVSADEFKKILSEEVVNSQMALIDYAISTMQAAIWFRVIDLLFTFADDRWPDQLMERLDIDQYVSPVFSRLIQAAVNPGFDSRRAQIEIILLIIACSPVTGAQRLASAESGLRTRDWLNLVDGIPGLTIAERSSLQQQIDKLTTPAGAATAITARAQTDTAGRPADLVGPGAEVRSSDSHNESPVPEVHEDEEGTGVAAMVDHAGLVILAPFIPAYLESRGVNVAGPHLQAHDLSRAAALLYLLATGHDQCHEYDLGLIKVLLGLSPDAPVLVTPGEMIQADLDEAEALISSAVTHWNAVGNLSVSGFRSSFIQRSALLGEETDSWNLQFERAGHDVLLDRLPWTIGVVRLPWMQKPINVNW